MDDQVIAIFEKEFTKRGIMGPSVKEAILAAVEKLETTSAPPPPMDDLDDEPDPDGD